MKTKVVHIVGCLAAWAGSLFTLWTGLQLVKLVICTVMLPLDHSATSSWNCGVLIYGVQSIAGCVIVLFFWVLSRWLLKENCWRVTTRQIGIIWSKIQSSG